MTQLFGSDYFSVAEEKPTLLMFSGQGSQYYQMGRDLYDSHEGFRRNMNELDTLIKEHLGESVIEHIYCNQNRITDRFDQLIYTHPAIFMLEVSLSRVLLDLNVKPDIVMGASLGELGAAYTAGSIELDECIRILVQQPKIVESTCAEAGMLAILNSEISYSETPELYEQCELASLNAKGHFVVSGTVASLLRIEAFLKIKDVTSLLLPVRYGFHSSLVDDSKVEFEAVLRDITWREPNIPFVSCSNAGYKNVFETNYFWDVVRNPIRLSETIHSLELIGNYNYIDVGASGVMANAVKANLKNGSSSKVFSILSPFGNNLANLGKVEPLVRKNKSNEIKEVKMKVFVFPGQGSQTKGMGAELFDEFPEYEKKADAILGYSIRKLCVEDSNRELNKTQFTQPALFVVNALSYIKKMKDEGNRPDKFAGHSLGEFNALFAAGVFDFETGLRLVKKRGELMSQAKDGGMAAVIGCNADTVVSLLKSNNLYSIDVANFNTPKQVVLSGPKADILDAAVVFEGAGATYFPLNVSAAFHSRYMKEAMNEFGHYLDNFDFNEPETAVISNVTARPYTPGSMKDNIKQQIVSSVRWTESIQFLISEGCCDVEELGPGNVLTKLFTQIKQSAPLPSKINDADSKQAPYIETVKSEVQAKEPTEKATEKPGITVRESTQNVMNIGPDSLGHAGFKRDYNLRYAYLSGSMYKAISSKELVVKMGKSGYLSFLGTGGVSLTDVESQLLYIKDRLRNGEPYGANVLSNLKSPEAEMALVKILLRFDVKYIEASAFMQVSPALVYYRLHSLVRDPQGIVKSKNKLIAKISRPEVANVFLKPAPERIVRRLLEENLITPEQAEMSKEVPVADDLCVESDSGGHTDMGVIAALLPSIIRLRDEVCLQQEYRQDVRVGAAGGIGTPESAASAFILGADFIVTGSINQCTVEAGTSNQVKDLLQNINVQDTSYAPAGDMFELGARVQVLKKGLFFPARANKLYDLWRYNDSIDDIDIATRTQLEQKYFKRSIDDVWAETARFYQEVDPSEIEKAEKNPKHKMALIFRWYFIHTTRLALDGDETQRVDFQVHCGPALGAFNQWVKGTELETWENRHVDKIADKLMTATADFLNRRMETYMN